MEQRPFRIIRSRLSMKRHWMLNFISTFNSLRLTEGWDPLFQKCRDYNNIHSNTGKQYKQNNMRCNIQNIDSMTHSWLKHQIKQVQFRLTKVDISDLKRLRGTRELYLSDVCKVFHVCEAPHLKAAFPNSVEENGISSIKKSWDRVL